jgi:hypothetical protein
MQKLPNQLKIKMPRNPLKKMLKTRSSHRKLIQKMLKMIKMPKSNHKKPTKASKSNHKKIPNHKPVSVKTPKRVANKLKKT